MPALLGIGNVDYGNDGFEVRLAEALEDSDAALGLPHVSSVRSGMSSDTTAYKCQSSIDPFYPRRWRMPQTG